MVHTDCVRTEDTIAPSPSPGPAAILGDVGVVQPGGFQQLDLPLQPAPWGLTLSLGVPYLWLAHSQCSINAY